MITLKNNRILPNVGGRCTMPVSWWNFPGGERGVRIDIDEATTPDFLVIECAYQTDQDIVDVALLTNAILNACPRATIDLLIPYFPYARQDRVMVSGESFGLQTVANIINQLPIRSVEVWDPHSDVLSGMFPPGKLKIVKQADLLKNRASLSIGDANAGEVALVSPDAGALKKIYPLAKELNVPVFEATKVREVSTGKITATRFQGALDPKWKKLIVVDDIIDGGRTFIEIAKELRRIGFDGELELMATHGIFSAGIDCLREYYSDIFVANDMRKVGK